jgi:hypothetical protein
MVTVIATSNPTSYFRNILEFSLVSCVMKNMKCLELATETKLNRSLNKVPDESRSENNVRFH